MTAPGGTPPGWYPDPQNSAQQRYWDGQAWTENVAPLAPPAPAAAPVQPAQQQYVPAPPPKSNKGCIIALVVLLVLVVLAVGGFFVALNVLGDKAEDFISDVGEEIESDLSDLDEGTTSIP